MDPRQMVALRKMMGQPDTAPEGAESPEEMAPEPLVVQCPGCGEQFDANSPEAQPQEQPQGDAPVEGIGA